MHNLPRQHPGEKDEDQENNFFGQCCLQCGGSADASQLLHAHTWINQSNSDTNLAVFPALAWLCTACCRWVYPSLSKQSHLSSLTHFRATLVLLTPWRRHVGLPSHVISAEKDSRAATEARRTWRPSLTDVFRLRRCSLSRLGGTGPKRWFMMRGFFPLLADTHCFLDEGRCRPDSRLRDFLSWMTLHQIDVRSDWLLC